jgi:hypothetical protein
VGFAVFEQELDDFPEVGLELIEGLALGMRAAPAGDVADVDPSIRIPFNDCGVGAHDALRNRVLKDTLDTGRAVAP